MPSPLIRVDINEKEKKRLERMAAKERVSVARLIGDAVRDTLLAPKKPASTAASE